MTRIKYFLMAIVFSSLYSFAAEKTENKTNIENDLEITNTGVVERIPGKPAPELFEKIFALNKARIGNSGQIVLVTNELRKSIDVNIQTFEKVNGKWVEKFKLTKGSTASLGFARFKEKREGDKKAPTGIFYFGPVFSYPGEKVTTKMQYWEAGENDYWIDGLNSDQYNRWVTSDIKPNVSCEPMRRTDDKYQYGVAIQYNMDQIKPNGSVIVLHMLIKPGESTLGCIAIRKKELIEIIGWLDAEKKPIIITGTIDELLTSPVSGPTLDKNDKYIWKKEIYTPLAK